MNIEIPVLVGLFLCGAQAYMWHVLKKFKEIVGLNILTIVTTYSTEIERLKAEVEKLKGEINRYEQKSRSEEG